MTTTVQTDIIEEVELQQLRHHGSSKQLSAPSPAQVSDRSASISEPDPTEKYPMFRKVTVTLQLSFINLANNAVNGLVIVGLPAMTADLQIPQSLSFWPASVSSLATASTLLLAGAIADVIGPRWVDLAGCLTNGALMIGAASSKTGSQFVGMRAVQGIGIAMHLASSVSIAAQMWPRGRGRNIAFSCLGLSQPLGFSLGLVIGGILVDLASWRIGWYIYGGITLAFTIIGLWALPHSHHDRSFRGIMHGFRNKVDWVGALLASGFMALLSYWLAIISTDVSKVKETDSIIILCFGILAAPCFLGWVHRQSARGKPALIPNKLWRNMSFSSICVTIALSFAVVNSMELFASLFFQEVQSLSALQASLRILPSLVVGVILNFTTGLFVDKIPALWIVLTSSLLCAVAPLLMAVIQPEWTYWANAFVAQLLQPISCDALFTVGLIVITDVFPDDTQGLAGAVFNTTAQFGGAIGLAIMQIISTQVTDDYGNLPEREALMKGYRASFWAMFAFMLACTLVGGLGMRKTGRIGLKAE